MKRTLSVRIEVEVEVADDAHLTFTREKLARIAREALEWQVERVIFASSVLRQERGSA